MSIDNNMMLTQVKIHKIFIQFEEFILFSNLNNDFLLLVIFIVMLCGIDLVWASFMDDLVLNLYGM